MAPSRTSDIRVALVHLGCARNLIDSETILGRLGAQGYALAGSVTGADVAILNTCSFIGPARAESEAAIDDLLAAKLAGEIRAVIVAGCLPERFSEQINARFPGVDAFLGLSDYANIARVVEEVLRGRKIRHGAGGRTQGGGAELMRLLQTPRSYAYLRPSHGCDHDCAFCIIPQIRGSQRSKPISAVLREAEQLVGLGVRELVLVAEDSTGYGRDLGRDGPDLADLVESLAGVSGLSWLRIMYAYPHTFPWRLPEVIRAHEQVLPYLDIPIQHIATPVLKAMRRGGTSRTVRGLLHRLREELPGLTLRTTILVGHPGEGEAEFHELLDFLADFRFERLGAFAFSPESATLAGERSDRCSTEEASDRLDAVMELQSEIHATNQRALIGEQVEVIIDEAGPVALGRTKADAPEVDGIIRVPDPSRMLHAGDLCSIMISGADGYDLLATPHDRHVAKQ